MDDQPKTQSDIYVTISFQSIGVGSFFMFMGNVCLKTSSTEAIMSKAMNQCVQRLVLGKDIPTDYKFELCDHSFSYVKRDEYDKRQSSKEDI